MQDNLLYLKEWMRYNPSLTEYLSVEGNLLHCKKNDSTESIDISEFYLPEMLYNENFRNSIALETEISGIDLFEIIKLYCETQEILMKEQKELQKYPKIAAIRVLKDQNNQEFILIVDEYNKKYRYNTNKPEEIINIYNDLKMKKQAVTLKELGSVIEHAN